MREKNEIEGVLVAKAKFQSKCAQVCLNVVLLGVCVLWSTFKDL